MASSSTAGSTSTSAASSPPASPSPSPPPDSLVECQICCEAVPTSSLLGVSSCTHRYCPTCLRHHWTSQIFSGHASAHTATLSCPSPGCAAPASEPDIASAVTPRTHARLRYFRSRHALAADKHQRWCDTDGCWRPLPPAPLGPPAAVVCTGCAARGCARCGAPWPAGAHVCAAPHRAPASAAAFRVYAALRTKTCPSCRVRIERAAGCLHMTCAACGEYFCWRCRGRLIRGAGIAYGGLGRPCACERVAGAVVYVGLVVTVVVLASPAVIVAGMVGVPYIVWRACRKNKIGRRRDRRGLDADGDDDVRRRAGVIDLDHARPAEHANATHAPAARAVIERAAVIRPQLRQCSARRACDPRHLLAC
jgi:IBR domain, a half RING-finger domain